MTGPVPDDVRKAAQSFIGNGYRGPLAWARKVFDWVAALPTLTDMQASAPAPLEAANAEAERAKFYDVLEAEPYVLRWSWYSDETGNWTVESHPIQSSRGLPEGFLLKTYEAAATPQVELSDTARLDWFEAHPHAVAKGNGMLGAPATWCWQDENRAFHLSESNTLRDALDRAILAARGKP